MAKLKRRAMHIEHFYEDKGVGKDEAEARAWATVDKQFGGGEKPGNSGSRTSVAREEDRMHGFSQARR